MEFGERITGQVALLCGENGTLQNIFKCSFERYTILSYVYNIVCYEMKVIFISKML